MNSVTLEYILLHMFNLFLNFFWISKTVVVIYYVAERFHKTSTWNFRQNACSYFFEISIKQKQLQLICVSNITFKKILVGTSLTTPL